MINHSDCNSYNALHNAVNLEEIEITRRKDILDFWHFIIASILSITNSIAYHNDSLTLYNKFASPLDQFVKVLNKEKACKRFKPFKKK